MIWSVFNSNIAVMLLHQLPVEKKTQTKLTKKHLIQLLVVFKASNIFWIAFAPCLKNQESVTGTLMEHLSHTNTIKKYFIMNTLCTKGILSMGYQSMHKIFQNFNQL